MQLFVNNLVDAIIIKHIKQPSDNLNPFACTFSLVHTHRAYNYLTTSYYDQPLFSLILQFDIILLIYSLADIDNHSSGQTLHG